MAERPKGFGYTAELEERKIAKYDVERERKAQRWLQALVGESFPSGSFQEALKDGVFLCKAINVLQPGTVRKIHPNKTAFKMMENISNFLLGCERYGLRKIDLFQTVDLYENQNMVQVIDTIYALGRKAQSKQYHGPTLGPKEASEHTRNFDREQQQRDGQSVIGLQMGSNRGASQTGMTSYGLQRQIYERY